MSKGRGREAAKDTAGEEEDADENDDFSDEDENNDFDFFSGAKQQHNEEDFSAAPVVASLAGFQKSELCSKSLLPISLMAPSASLSMGL